MLSPVTAITPATSTSTTEASTSSNGEGAALLSSPILNAPGSSVRRSIPTTPITKTRIGSFITPKQVGTGYSGSSLKTEVTKDYATSIPSISSISSDVDSNSNSTSSANTRKVPLSSLVDNREDINRKRSYDVITASNTDTANDQESKKNHS
ncbi:unnamed protein product [[Candida] boidinii]|uniref:Unnamed protein product n=1 Tax=Candida boidinii TaxID=5477 RepID=A0ACB5U526_CANBO|nr:unnamed protein product [[Candida] boidinii]